jgi:hypothetical protein
MELTYSDLQFPFAALLVLLSILGVQTFRDNSRTDSWNVVCSKQKRIRRTVYTHFAHALFSNCLSSLLFTLTSNTNQISVFFGLSALCCTPAAGNEYWIQDTTPTCTPMKRVILWAAMSQFYWRLGGTHYLHLQGRWINQYTRRQIPEDNTLHNHRHENLKSNNIVSKVYSW